MLHASSMYEPQGGTPIGAILFDEGWIDAKRTQKLIHDRKEHAARRREAVAGSPPAAQKGGSARASPSLRPIPSTSTTVEANATPPAELESMIAESLTPEWKELFEKHGEVDIAYTLPEVATSGPTPTGNSAGPAS